MIDLRTNPANDIRLSPMERHILAVVRAWPGVTLGVDDIGFPELTGAAPTLNQVWLASDQPKYGVFHAVGRLEELGYLPDGVIR